MFFFNRDLEYLKACILAETFYIGGECQSSGNCCSGIMLFFNGYPLDTVAKFQDVLSKDFKYQRFNYQSGAAHRIQSYDCSELSKDNRCLDYENRPDFCRSYPYSYFIEKGFLRSGCGYNVRLRHSVPFFGFHL